MPVSTGRFWRQLEGVGPVCGGELAVLFLYYLPLLCGVARKAVEAQTQSRCAAKATHAPRRS
jgi:hypothetical protein